MSTDALFYKNLQAVPTFRQVVDVHQYKVLPESWYVVLTDIENSTNAIQNGKYKEVNLLGVAPLIGILNETDSSLIPFIFGGDGISLCVPGSLLPLARDVLKNTIQIAQKEYGLKLRAGIVPVKAIHNAGEQILISKFRASEHYEQASFFGGGLSLAEKWLKNGSKEVEFIYPDAVESISYKGLECRWQPIKSKQDFTISILIKSLSTDKNKQIQLYSEYLDFFDKTFKDPDLHPIQSEKMNMNTSILGLAAETKIRTFGLSYWNRFLYALETKFRIWAGKIMMHYKVATESTAWGNYKTDLIANSDFRKFDEMIRQVVSCSQEQLNSLNAWLEERFQKKELVYGIHQSKEALITCMVFQYDKAHIHFVDGNNGGYTAAAIELKRRIKELAN
ncbi:DUF3095 domain-containing protein [bacterium]|nr:MAG: DUF3095 domain-containing protein [bacterium]